MPTLWLIKLCGGYSQETREDLPKDFFVAKEELSRPVIAQIFGFSRRFTVWDEVPDHLKWCRYPQITVAFFIIGIILIG